jgi:hypothetical protein
LAQGLDLAQSFLPTVVVYVAENKLCAPLGEGEGANTPEPLGGSGDRTILRAKSNTLSNSKLRHGAQQAYRCASHPASGNQSRDRALDIFVP